MFLDSEFKSLSPVRTHGAGGFPLPHAPCASNSEIADSIKFAAGWGGARARAGRPRKVVRLSATRDIFRWYVARARYGQTALADREIRQAGYTVFAPTVFKPAVPPRRDSAGVMRPGKPDRVDYLFVRYIIVSLNLSDPSWREVLACDGVERIISGGHLANGGVGIPIAVPDEAIAWVRQLLNVNGCVDPRVFREKPIKVGARLRMIDGPMPDREGVCAMSDGARVMLLINLLGRPVSIEMAQSAVEVV